MSCYATACLIFWVNVTKLIILETCFNTYLVNLSNGMKINSLIPDNPFIHIHIHACKLITFHILRPILVVIFLWGGELWSLCIITLIFSLVPSVASSFNLCSFFFEEKLTKVKRANVVSEMVFQMFHSFFVFESVSSWSYPLSGECQGSKGKCWALTEQSRRPNTIILSNWCIFSNYWWKNHTRLSYGRKSF